MLEDCYIKFSIKVQKKDTKKIYALKAIKTCQLNDENQLQYALTESEILKKINHPYIVNLHYTFQVLLNLRFSLLT